MSRSVRALVWSFAVAAALFSAFWFWNTARPLDESQLKKEYTGEILGCDYYMRYNEIACLREGIDPFDVWNETVPHSVYVSNCHLDRRTDTWYEPINAYTPWSYVYFMPLAFMPRSVSWWWYYAMMLVSTLVWVAAAFRYGWQQRGDTTEGALAAGLALCLGPVLASGLICANYTVVIAGALAVLIYGLSREDRFGDVMAGLALALAMTKPQLSALLVVPMLIKRRICPLIIGAAVCLGATALAASMCGKSVLTLILEAPQGNVFAFKGCGLMPMPMYRMLVGLGLAQGAVLALVAGLGLVICVALSWRMRRETDWMRLMVPAVVCSVAWTYVQPPSHLISWVVMAVFAIELVRARDWRARMLSAAMLLSVGRFYYIPVKVFQKLGFSGGEYDAIWNMCGDVSALSALVLMVLVVIGNPSRSNVYER